MAAVLQPHGPMVNGLGSSLMSRRTAGNNLPGPLELPVNTLTARFGGPLSSSVLPTVLNHQHPQSSISALLTPPNVSGESMSPISSVSNSASNPAAIGIQPYTPTSGYYPASNQYTAPPSQSQIHGMAQPWNQSINNNNPRGRFSPSLASLMRNPTTGSPSDSLPPPSYDLGALPPFPNTIVQQGHVSPPSQQNNNLPYNMTSQAPPPPLQSPVAAQDPYMQKLPPTPGFYPSMTPQQSQFPQYNPASPPLQSPLSATTSGSRSSPPPSMQVFNRPYNSMSMPGMQSPGHMPPNYGSPGFHQAMFNSGTAAQLGHMYGPQQGQPPLDRPFKCDQCPQSFNRNHDLKRHKRIHLAVKPFPCKFCDKSFSRKDALKRHILVKGCGKTSSDAKSPDIKDGSSSGTSSPVNATH
ncbi:MAG: hypothetical protein GOMPHAMPRED_008164 [Gomphillus americanus]|uniref:C2H2-type domain-containing protein n=1 Tax=Gomphillus americanus TaxID=1940652 RepID=A0A8H3F508_9LECA|nr:MAG: hypothetical protein GOMPHAMPRED_008164 [Gomphillus americanus]